jgi:hypothetical protein
MRYPLIIDGPYKGYRIGVEDYATSICYQETKPVSLDWSNDVSEMPTIKRYYLYKFIFLNRLILIASKRSVTEFNEKPMPVKIMSDIADVLFSDKAKAATIDNT